MWRKRRRRARKAQAASDARLRARMRRPKGRAAPGAPRGINVINQPQSRWVTHGLTAALLLAVTSSCIAWVTTRNNHSFGTNQASTQARTSESLARQMSILEQKSATYPKLQAEIIDLGSKLGACYAVADTMVDSGKPIPPNLTDRQAFVQELVVTPVRTASQRLGKDSQAFISSPAVRQLIQGLLNLQPESASLCSKSSHLLVWYGNDQSPRVVADEQAAQKTLKSRMDYIANEYTKLAQQINSELGIS
jgi:hypothetical protein